MTLHGVLAAFADADLLSDAARAMRERGYRHMDAYSPYPVDGLAETLAMPKTKLPWIVLAGGVTAFVLAYGLILYSVEIDYPLDVGGRPLHSWPAFIVIAFEAAILGAAMAGFIGVIVANGLPRYYHPAFNGETFTFARGGGFYLLVEASDPCFGRAATKAQLRRLGAASVVEVKA